MSRSLTGAIDSAACRTAVFKPEKEKSTNTATPEKEKQPEPAKPDDPTDAASYVGMTLEAAKARADKAGIPNRVVEEDGVSNPVTMDHRPERLNFAVKAGKIIRVTKG